MNKDIGGYFELELPDFGGFLHNDGVLLNSGRNALEYILLSLPDVRHLWIPYYTCDVVLEPIKKLDISFSFYRIDERLEIQDYLNLQAGDYLLYTNYFGIKDHYVQHLADRYGMQLIVDNAQAWYADPIPGTSTIYSPRKFVGIPDGGIAFCPCGISIDRFEVDQSYGRCSHLLKRIDLDPSAGYPDYRENSRSMINQPIRKMSKFTERMLKAIDFNKLKQIRLANFEFLVSHLESKNLFVVPDSALFQCPMVYPFLSKDSSLRKNLIDNRIYIASYWQDVLKRVSNGEPEYVFSQCLLPIPIDQRYSINDLCVLFDFL